MKKFNLQKKFLFFLVFILVFAGIAEARTSRTQNIANLFMRVNPRLKANKATDYAKVVIHAAEKYSQDPYAIAAIIVHESTVNPNAISKGGDYGLMQIRWKVHEKAIKKQFPRVKRAKDILDVRINVSYGTQIFADCMKKAGNNLRGGILRYSAGNERLANKVLSTVKELQGGSAKQVKSKKRR